VTDNQEFWGAIVTGEAGVMRRERRRHRRIPGAPRCKTCLVPLGGPAAPVVRLVLKRRPSAKNPNYCDVVRDVRADPSRRRRGRDLDAVRRRATADLVPVGAGVHTGVAYVGAVGSNSTVADFTALGDAVNVTARLASLAGAREALISEACRTNAYPRKTPVCIERSSRPSARPCCDDDRLRLGSVVDVGARGDRLERDRGADLDGGRDQRLQPRRELVGVDLGGRRPVKGARSAGGGSSSTWERSNIAVRPEESARLLRGVAPA
jgi:hypothetical protein